jgi:hypothetical protein
MKILSESFLSSSDVFILELFVSVPSRIRIASRVDAMERDKVENNGGIKALEALNLIMPEIGKRKRDKKRKAL